MASSFKDLLEEAKKRALVLFVCVVGLSYLMSLTSSSVFINIPAAMIIILLLRYASIEAKNHTRGPGTSAMPSSSRFSEKKLSVDAVTESRSAQIDWRKKVDSPSVEAALDKLSRHLVSEWLTDLWYKKITPDHDAPEELVIIINGVLGEICLRAKDVNLIELITRDLVNLFCENLMLYRVTQSQIGEDFLNGLSVTERDAKLKATLATSKKLHPAVVSSEVEHKVLQRLMDGLLKLTCRSEDLQCSFFRYLARELLACAVIRPVINLASPKFINERIESAVLSFRNRAKQVKATEPEKNEPKARSRYTTDHFSEFPDKSLSGVELVQLGPGDKKKSLDTEFYQIQNESLTKSEYEKRNNQQALSSHIQRAELVVPQLKEQADTRKYDAINSESKEKFTVDGKAIHQRRPPGGDWVQMLEAMSRKKNQVLAPEHYDNMWSKGRDYKKKEPSGSAPPNMVNSKVLPVPSVNANQPRMANINKLENASTSKMSPSVIHTEAELIGVNKSIVSGVQSDFSSQLLTSKDVNKSQVIEPMFKEGPSPLLFNDKIRQEEVLAQSLESAGESYGSYTSEEDESNSVMGLDSPGVKVWDSKSSRKGLSHVHHPLENFEGAKSMHRRKGKLQQKMLYKTLSGRKRNRIGHGTDKWQELERTSFYLSDGLDILKASEKIEMQMDDQDVMNENISRLDSESLASSSKPANYNLVTNILPNKNAEVLHVSSSSPTQYLRCKVLGANIAKSGTKTIAVYSISVNNHANRTWSIKRRFRHFEELHRRLKEYPEYCLHLPPKHILSSSLDSSVVYERCTLLDRYLKELLFLPGVAESIEVWDFLSVDSQTYMFSNSLTIIETLSVDLEDKHRDQNKMAERYAVMDDKLAMSSIDSKNVSIKDSRGSKGGTNQAYMDGIRQGDTRNEYHSESDSDYENGKLRTYKQNPEVRTSNSWEDESLLSEALDEFEPTENDAFPSEWMLHNLSVPILNLVDVVFQLQDGGWIRRNVFWVAKQVLQLGMGDALDDWLIEKIQLLRKGEVIASGIKRLEQILWPDGIFLTKHPRRQQPSSPVTSQKESSYKRLQAGQPQKTDLGKLSEHQAEDSHSANFVRELLIDKAPAVLVSLVGHKEYERCAGDIFFFLQSAVFLKQLAYGLLELLLLAAFPELDEVVSSCHSEEVCSETV